MSESLTKKSEAGCPEHLWKSRIACVCAVNRAGFLLHTSSYFRTLISPDKNDPHPLPLASIIHPEDRASFMADVENVRKRKTLMEHRLVRLSLPGGRVLSMEAWAESFFFEDEGEPGVLLWWRERPEEMDSFVPASTEDTPSELDRWVEMLKDFTASLFSPLFLLNPEGRIVHANPAALELLDYRGFELIHRPVAILFAPRSEQMANAMLRFIKQMRSGRMRDHPSSWFNRRGESIPVSMSGAVLRSRSGELLGMVVTGRDERKNALFSALEKKNEELSRAYEELKVLDQMKDDLMSLVGHELRAPLANILGYAEFLKEWKLSEAEKKEYIQIIYIESQRLSRLVNDILDLSRMEAGRMKYVYVRDSINRVVEAALDSLRPEAEEKKLRIELHLDDQIEPLEFDPDRIQQVVTNILHNAIKFSDPGRSIKVWTEMIEGGLRVSIQDYGPGIDPQNASKVFTKFEQLTPVNHHHRGAGLGMPIAKQIVEEGHGGHLWFESDGRGRGTIFKFTLPERRQET